MRKQIKEHPRITILILFLIVLAATILIGGYRLNWAWTGLNGDKESYKTLYDWLQLLIIPVVLAVAGFWFNHRERKEAEQRAETDQEIEQQRAQTERDIAEDNQREAALQAYINEMSELLLHENLRDSEPENEVRNIARVRTLTVLPYLDGKRKCSVLKFLHESKLIVKDNTIVNVSGADLSNADLSKANITNADLIDVNLAGANLSMCFFKGTTLRYATLEGADLDYIMLTEVDLTKANLKGANLENANLTRADFAYADLTGASLFRANLYEANLWRTNLTGVDLYGANLYGAELYEANLTRANLRESNLIEANLEGTKLDDANLIEAKITDEQFDRVKSFQGIIMRDGSRHT